MPPKNRRSTWAVSSRRISSAGVSTSSAMAKAAFISGVIASDFAPRSNTPPPGEINAGA
jgi:hypothetical protein